MSTFNLLIDFLEEKVRNINIEIEEANVFIANYEWSYTNQTLNDQFILEQMINTNRRQEVVIEIINMMQYLSRIKNKSKRCENYVLETEVDKFINEKVYAVVSNTISYNENFPLYGFYPFNQKLLKHYINTENFEKCSELQKHKSLIN